MHGFDGQHVEAAQCVLDMHDGGDGDDGVQGADVALGVNAEHDLQMLVVVADQGFIKGVFEHREDADPIAGAVAGCWFSGLQGRQGAQVLEPHQTADQIARTHADFNPARRFARGKNEVLQCRQTCGVRDDAPGVVKAGPGQSLCDAAAGRNCGFNGMMVHAVSVRVERPACLKAAEADAAYRRIRHSACTVMACRPI